MGIPLRGEPDALRGCGRNLLQIHLPAEGDWLSVAHLAPPGAEIGAADGRRANPNSRVLRHRAVPFVPKKIAITRLDSVALLDAHSGRDTSEYKDETPA